MANTYSVNLRVNLTNSYSDSKNINLPNPRNDVTLAEIREAFAEALASDVFVAGTEYLTQVKGARRIVTQGTDIT